MPKLFYDPPASRKKMKRARHHSLEVTPAVPVKDFCRSFGLTQEALTRLAGFSPRAVAHWVHGRPPGNAAQKRLTELIRLFDALSDLVEVETISSWLKQPNAAFDGSTPLQVIERGESDRLWRMIWELQAGNVG